VTFKSVKRNRINPTSGFDTVGFSHFHHQQHNHHHHPS